MSGERLDPNDTDQFVDDLFDAALVIKPGLQRLVSNMPEDVVRSVLASHSSVIKRATLKSLDSVFGAELVGVRLAKIDVLFDSMSDLLMRFIEVEMCPARHDAYRSLFRCSAHFFVRNFK